MSDIKNHQLFVDIEYCISKYYNENFAPLFSSTKNAVRQKQAKEFETVSSQNSLKNLLSSGTGFYGDEGFQNQRVLLQKTGEWNKKTTDDIMVMVEKKINSDAKLKSDSNTLVIALRAALVSSIGQERYRELSLQCASKDLAVDYYVNRIRQNMVEQLAKEKMPKSSFEYIATRAGKESLIGLLHGLTNNETVTDDHINELAEKMYAPSGTEKLTGDALSLVIDGVTTGGTSSIGAAVKTVSTVGALKLAGSLVPQGDEKTYFQQFGQLVFGNENATEQIKEGTYKVNAKQSYIIANINETLENKIKVPRFQLPFSQEVVQNNTTKILKSVQGDADALLDTVKGNLKDVDPARQSIPKWMLQHDRSDNITLSARFLSIAIEMKAKNQKAISINGKSFTIEKVKERAICYALVARAQQDVEEKEANTKTDLEKASTAQTVQSINNQPTMQSSNDSKASMPPPPNQQSVTPCQPQSLKGWNAMTEQFGLSGINEVGKNMGYCLAMLPDLIIGMFTGSSKIKFQDNLFPIAAILGGMFVRNRILKLLLIGLGGAGLLFKAGQDAMANSGKTPSRQYKRYEDEKLDSRMNDVIMKGNTLLATVDQVPWVFTIQSDAAVDAYYKGVLPLNVLANAVLRKQEEQKQTISLRYDMSLETEEEQKLVIR